MLKIVLLDRDGVLNRELGGYVTSVDDFEVLPHVIPNLKRLKEKGCRFVIITNQSGISKSLYTHQVLSDIHSKLIDALEQEDLFFEEIYYCPHHPDFGLCLCRKPLGGMIEKALARFGVKPSEAIMIGDTQRDIEAAEAAGVYAYKINSNQNWDFVVDDVDTKWFSNNVL